MKTNVLLAVILNLSAIGAAIAAPVSGVVSNRFGDKLGYAEITAVQSGTPSNVVHATAGRSGEYTIELENGEWLLELDSVQLAEWGYKAFAMPLVIAGSGTVEANLVPEATEPPIRPVLTLTEVTEERFTLLIEGGGGRVFRIERSPDLRVWTYMTTLTTAKGRISYGSNFYWEDPEVCFWRVLITE